MKMEKNKKNFITGETYTLAELFSGNRRIVIPDLQRDYCWGDETNQKSSGKGELVTDFVNNLIAQYKVYRHDTLNLGLFYGYEVPANHIQLCDGQQRLTTLYLLLGMLNKKVGKFQQHLISDYEYYDDDKEPYLNYAIRESSLYFLSDLVCNFFISNDNNVDSITKADWFFNDYKFDPSICSMINALKKIEKILQEQEDKQEDKLNYGAFGDWVLNKLTFLYFDMENRKNGEETFVIINTTGEPLSATQNLKPLVINAERKKGMDDRDKQWEEIETWFWNNRHGDNDTADAGFEEFLRWVSIIEQKKDEALIQQILKGEGKCEFPYKNIRFDKIYGYWKAFVWIMAENELFPFKYPFKDIKREEIKSPKANSGVNGRKAIGQNVCFVLLPLLSFVYKYRETIETDEKIKRNAKRVYEFFANLISIGNVSRNVNELVQKALLTIDNLKDGDIVSILDSSEEISKQILTEEERCKLEILRQNTPHRNAIEETFWEIQRHEVWQGEIMPLIESANAENGKFDSSKFTLNEFGKSVHVFRLLFCKKDQHDDIIYLLRRCVIMCLEPCEPYKPVARGSYSYYNTFGWTWNDWHEILCTPNSHHSRMKYLFKYILGQTKEEKIEDITIDTLATILEMFIKESPTTNEYIEFAKDDYLLSFTKGVGACDMDRRNNDWQICTKGGINKHTDFFSRRNALILKEFGGKYENNNGGLTHELKDKIWGVWYWVDGRANCIVFQRNDQNIKLDVWFQSNDKGGGTLNIELKRIDNKDISDPFPDIMNALQGFDRKDGNVVAKEYVTFDSSQIKKVIEDTMETVNTAFDNNMDSNNHVNAE